jgi:hypothetical protein
MSFLQPSTDASIPFVVRAVCCLCNCVKLASWKFRPLPEWETLPTFSLCQHRWSLQFGHTRIHAYIDTLATFEKHGLLDNLTGKGYTDKYVYLCVWLSIDARPLNETYVTSFAITNDSRLVSEKEWLLFHTPLRIPCPKGTLELVRLANACEADGVYTYNHLMYHTMLNKDLCLLIAEYTRGLCQL